MSTKAFSNFVVGIVLLIGIVHLARVCCPKSCRPEQFNAYTGKPLHCQGEEGAGLIEDGIEEWDEDPEDMVPLHPGDKVTMSSGLVGVVAHRLSPGHPHFDTAAPLCVKMENEHDLRYSPDPSNKYATWPCTRQPSLRRRRGAIFSRRSA